jgi:hypothetical protein
MEGDCPPPIFSISFNYLGVSNNKMSTKQVTVPSTGRVVSVRTPDNTKLLLRFQRMYPAPSPRLQEVNYGTKAKPNIRYEYNYSDPSFRMALTAYDEYKTQWLNEKALNLIVDCFILGDQDKADVSEWIERTGNPDNLSPSQIFFEEIALPEMDDLAAVMEALKPPSPEEVRAASESFQG